MGAIHSCRCGSTRVTAIARRNSYAQIYVDGALTRTSTPNTTALTDTSPVRIGASATTGGYFSGQIDEVALYNTELNGLRVLSHYRLGTQLDSVAPNPTITAPANGSSTTNAALNFTGTAGNSTNDASALTVSIAPDPNGGPLSVFDYDEFGTPRNPSQAGRYGYLGSKQRSAELPSGIIAMGARSYVPALGRFLQTDPIQGGSANPTTTQTPTPSTRSTRPALFPGLRRAASRIIRTAVGAVRRHAAGGGRWSSSTARRAVRSGQSVGVSSGQRWVA